MPNRGFADLTQKQWCRACKKLGLIVEKNAGKGSHVLVKNPASNKKYTIQKNLNKLINQKIFKILLEWGFAEDEIWQSL